MSEEQATKGNIASDLLIALEQAVMDMELMRMAATPYDRNYFAPCIERAKATAEKAREEIASSEPGHAETAHQPE